ncbi:MAG: hypothetical protein QM796_19275 [Chthoniobacteraceae bacterium]
METPANPIAETPANAQAGLQAAMEKYEAAERPISKEVGTEIINLVSRAFADGLLQWPEESARGYQMTGEILDAWGDEANALEYYRYAVDCNPGSPVRERYNELSLVVRKRQEAEREQRFINASRQRLASLLEGHREFVSTKLESIRCRYRPAEGEPGEPTLWQVLEMTNTGALPQGTEVCLQGSERWQPVEYACEEALG